MKASRANASADKSKLKRTIYEKELRKLQVQLCQLQDWVKHKGLRVIIVFEGRDAAGKGGTIKAITDRVSPRVFRVVALPAPSSREKTQMYFQRYIPYFPAAGEIIIFDRSWYNRAGVEYVMGFCTDDGASAIFNSVPGSRAIHRRWGHPADQILAWRSARKSKSDDSWLAFTIPCDNGSSAQWISNHTSDGTNTRRPAT